ncbi:FMN-dependent NADH-azoreductase [Motiliproteus sp. SC1-56]|uniref:FMN-dependent NADH-azoreductase n=1 Tax=Motiliproteus sp. SC1-56 TaxID=2799565 RepID=UPI001A8F4D7C|nr:NAD(P)H-dependent oxidoreductase [Motiliproteus sp. SC1-56]
MPTLLVINSSPVTDNSVTRPLVQQFVEGWKARNPEGRVIHRDIGRNPPPLLDEVTIGAFYTAPEARNAGQQRAVALSDELVDELVAADALVIGAPMHNFTVTGALKSYLDQVARVGRTFKYTDQGPEGLLADKPVYLITSSGGDYRPGAPAAALNHRDEMLRTVLGFLGLTDLHFVHAAGVAAGEAGVDEARAALAALA